MAEEEAKRTLVRFSPVDIPIGPILLGDNVEVAIKKNIKREDLNSE